MITYIPSNETLFLRSAIGRLLRVVCIIDNDTDANQVMRLRPELSVATVIGNLVLLVKHDDKGIPTQREVTR